MLSDRLLAKSERDPETGCLRWSGHHARNGYGVISIHDRPHLVHRVAYEEWVGPIPLGYDVDHVRKNGCRHRDCLEPSHLEAVTHRENLLRGDTIPAKWAARAECPEGHPFTEENTYIKKDGSRQCRICRREARRAYRLRRLNRDPGYRH